MPALVAWAQRAARYVQRKRAYAERRLEGCPLERFAETRIPHRSGAHHGALHCTCECHIARRERRIPKLLP